MTNATAPLRPAPSAAAIMAPDHRAPAARGAMPVRFAAVGAIGCAINVAVYALLLQGTGAGYRASAPVAFLAEVANNFGWKRRWTLHAHGGRPASSRYRSSRWRRCLVLAGLAGIDTVPAGAVAAVGGDGGGLRREQAVGVADTSRSADSSGEFRCLSWTAIVPR